MTADKMRPGTMTRAAFVEKFGGVYEHTPWIAENAFDRGLTVHHDDPLDLANYMAQIIDDADEFKKMALLCAHPDLAGKLAKHGELTQSSAAEQSSARLDQCSEIEFAEFTSLNIKYKEKFGFPFILAVRDHDRTSILQAFRQRVDNSKSEEIVEALRQVNRIAALRIAAILQSES